MAVKMQIDETQLSRKEREEAFRRDLVLDAAEKLFADKGFDGTTVADIAQASELAKGSLYQLFQSKEEIITAIIQKKMIEITSRLEVILNGELSPVDKIFNIIRTKFETLWRERRFAKIFFHELRGFHWCIEGQLIEIQRDIVFRILDRIEQVIKDGQRVGQFRSDISSSTIFTALEGMSNGVILTWLRDPDTFDLEKAVREVQDLFLRGALPPERSSQLES
jgi:AcrR family transcriptional regulator